MGACVPVVRWWGRMQVTGLEHLPPSGPVLLAGNHDSYWDPVSMGIAAMPVRQIHALAKAEIWKFPGLSPVMTGMGQIPVQRGTNDVEAFQRAVRELKAGKCIGVFPEGTRSLGRELRPRRGIGRLAELVPEAEIVLVTATGTTDIVAEFPRKRPQVRVRFFRPEGGGLQPGESATELSARLLAELRRHAPIVPAGRKRRIGPPVS